ncbi:MAG: ComF family protein, partial [Eggerthellaceae bacterium]|nr:ComF family protein [Eggerthellaceae bacterium]
QGEQRLAQVMAELMARAVQPDRRIDAITFVPATLAAYRYRGYDHAQLLAESLSCELGIEAIPLLARPKTLDQRVLGRAERVENLKGRFSVLPATRIPTNVLLVDDVFTTGATLCGATDALLAAGADMVGCLTFARV